MKVRLGFVTNSSSSSFIIGKDVFEHIDDVYSYVKELYLEYSDMVDYAIEYTMNNPNCGWKYDEKKGFYIPNNKDLKIEERWSVRNKFEKFTGLNWYEILPRDILPEWTKCYTYKDYEQYWINQNDRAPFTIGDYLDKEITWLHWGSVKVSEILETGFDNEEIEWYWYEIEDETKHSYEDVKVDGANLCYMFLGRFCIYSECGYIPQWIVERLGNISKFWCNHMG